MPLPDDSAGVLYVAFGAPYLAMAMVSIQSLRMTNPSLPVCLVTNVRHELPIGEWWRPTQGDIQIVLDLPDEDNRKVKTSAYRYAPFEKTLFLDCDTLVLRDVSQAFTFLDFFDLIARSEFVPSHLPSQKILDGRLAYSAHGHFNSGVLGFRRSTQAHDFFDAWQAAFDRLASKYDQPAFLEALYLSRARLLPLAPRWNRGDRWFAPARERDDLVVFHYKQNLEPFVERGMIEMARLVHYDADEIRTVEDYIELKREQFRRRYLKWLVKRTVMKLRGYHSRWLEHHPNAGS